MANTIDQAFIKQFETEVHMAYQRMGSKLRNTVRTAGNVRGNVVRFQKIGAGSANTKSRNGNVTPMELAHTNVEATMQDFFAPEFIDKLDELKTNIDERQAVAQSAAAALGRKTDDICTQQWMLVQMQLRFTTQVLRLQKLTFFHCLKLLVLQTSQKMVNAILLCIQKDTLICSTLQSLLLVTLLVSKIFLLLVALQ